jgi:Fe-S-cluster-containing hydrogenase component 2
MIAAPPSHFPSPSMTKSLTIVPDRCTGCMQCELACSWVQTGTFQPSRSVIRVNVFDEEASYAPFTCLQCDEAWCMQACPVNAIDIDPVHGAKIVFDQACVGCHLCTIACPFGTVFSLPKTDKAAKCNLCGGQPACAAACPTGAIEWTAGAGAGAWLGPWGEKVDLRFHEELTGGPR